MGTRLCAACFKLIVWFTPPPQAIFMIPTKPPPTLKEPNKFSNEFSDFISRCLVKNPEERPSATALLQQKFIKSAKPVSVLKDLVQYAQRIVEEEEDSGSDVSFQYNSTFSILVLSSF